MDPEELLQSSLDALANSLQVIYQGPGEVPPGQPVGLSLTQTPPVLEVPQVLAGAVDLTWLTKNVRFDSTDPASDAVAGPMPTSPVPPLTGTIGVSDVSLTPDLLEGVPGTVNRLQGTVPVPVQVQYPVAVSVAWSVTDAEGKELDPGDEYLAPTGLGAFQVTLLFLPEIVELTAAGTGAPTQRRVRATVTLAAGEQSVTRTLEVPIAVLPLGVPTVLAMFRHARFKPTNHGAVLLVVPSDSPFAIPSQVNQALQTLRSVLTTLRQFSQLASLLFGVEALSTALPVQPYLKFRKADQLRLEGLVVVPTQVNLGGSRYQSTAEETSSMLLIGPYKLVPRDQGPTGSLWESLEEHIDLFRAPTEPTSPAVRRRDRAVGGGGLPPDIGDEILLAGLGRGVQCFTTNNYSTTATYPIGEASDPSRTTVRMPHFTLSVGQEMFAILEDLRDRPLSALPAAGRVRVCQEGSVDNELRSMKFVWGRGCPD